MSVVEPTGIPGPLGGQKRPIAALGLRAVDNVVVLIWDAAGLIDDDQLPVAVFSRNADRLALLPKGAVILNPGRGPLIDDDALLAALDRGQIGHATLDVFRVEPLPQDHPYWTHPNVTVTPHIAADTRAITSSKVIAENIRRGEAGEPLLHLVDRRLGY